MFAKCVSFKYFKLYKCNLNLSKISNIVKIIFGDLTSFTQGLLHYFDTCCRTNPHHNIASQSHHQEAIKFRVAENVINQDRTKLKKN